MSNQTFIQIPPEIANDPDVLRRFLIRLVEKLDILFGFRGNQAYLDSDDIEELTSFADLTSIEGSLQAAIELAKQEAIQYTDDNSTNNPEQVAITDLAAYSQTMSATYNQTEVQDLSNAVTALTGKVNSILSALRAAEIIEV